MDRCKNLLHQKGEIKTMEEQRCYRPSSIRPRVNLPRPPSHVSTLHIAATQEYMHIDRLADGSNLDETILRIVHTCRLRSSFPIGPARRDREDLVLSICLLWSPSAWHPSRSCDPKKLPSCGRGNARYRFLWPTTSKANVHTFPNLRSANPRLAQSNQQHQIYMGGAGWGYGA